MTFVSCSREYGDPAHSSLSTIDQQLVEQGVASAAAAGTCSVHCAPLRKPFRYEPQTRLPVLYLWSRGGFTVSVRRFSDKWVRLGAARGGEVLLLVLPNLSATQLWQVRADGACQVGPRR